MSHQETVQTKRENYLAWKDYFMAVALLAAKRSKDPVTQVGACIVNEDKKIVGIGYNGMPIGCHDDEFPWSKNTASPLDSKFVYVCHAELNAIMNRNTADLKNCTMYVTLYPCNECAKLIIQSGIKNVWYMSDKNAQKDSGIAARRMLEAAGVQLKQFTPRSNEDIVIKFM